MINYVGALNDHYAGKMSLPVELWMLSIDDEQSHQSHNRADPVSLGGNRQDETGIKIQRRQPRVQQGSESTATQGNAARRIRLWTDSAPMSICDGKSSEVNSFSNEEQDAESVITEVRLIN